jgi:hypothetical protein
VLALALASKGDAITGIKRADTASVKPCSMSGDPAHDGKSMLRAPRGSRGWNCDHRTVHKFRGYQRVRAGLRWSYHIGRR